MKNDDKWLTNSLTTAEAAARCGVKRVTILAWLARGHLRGRKWGRDWRLSALAVDQCAAARKVGRPRKVIRNE